MKEPNSPTLSRRAFFKTVATGAAGAAITFKAAEGKAFSFMKKKPVLSPDRVTPTFCEVCYWKCGVVAKVRKNRILSLEGHPDYPNALGKLCGRGNAGAGFVTDSDRLKYPMVRVGKRGEGKFKRVGWKTAYRLIAKNFNKIKQKYGAEAVGLYLHGTGGTFISTLMSAFGTPNQTGPSYSQCRAARNVGYKLTLGAKPKSPEELDFEHTRCMVFFGSHLGENAHNSQVQEFVRARRRGAKLVVLDPRMSTVAARADVWLRVNPGSDLAIILAWLHLLVTKGAYDKEFVDKYCLGLEALKKHVQPFTPAWAARESGVTEKEIREAYRLMAAAMPAVLIHPGRHVSWYGEADTQRARGQAILTALLGAWWTPGGTYRTKKLSLPDFPTPPFPDFKPDVDKASRQFPLAQELTTTGLRDATRTGKPYPVKGWFVYGCNLIQSVPNIHETVEAIEKLDFIAVCDILPTEITKYADVLLPEDTYLERYDDLILGATKTPYIGLRQPVVKSPHDTRPAWRIAKELGQEMGLGEFFAFDTIEQYLETRLKGSGTTLAQLKKKGLYIPKGKFSLYLDRKKDYQFNTPSKKIELYSETLAKAGYDPLPVYKAQDQPKKGNFRLIYGRNPLHSFSRSQNNPILHDLAPSNCAWINPKCAKSLGIAHLSPVVVKNSHGDKTDPMPARVTERIPEKVIYMIHGFGHNSPGMTRACCTGGNDTQVLDRYKIDPISGGSGMRTQFVTVHPVKPDKEVYPCS